MGAVFGKRTEIPRVYHGETRLFYESFALNQDNLHELCRRVPVVEEAAKRHCTRALDKIKEISHQLVKAQLNFQGGEADQRHTRVRKLQQRMYQSEHYEQLIYQASILQGFCRAGSSHMRHRDGEARLAEFIGKLVDAPHEIE